MTKCNSSASPHSLPFSSPVSFSCIASRHRFALASACPLPVLLSPHDRHASWICFMFSRASFLAFFRRSPWPWGCTDMQERVRDCTHHSGPKAAILLLCPYRSQVLAKVTSAPWKRDWSPSCSLVPAQWGRQQPALDRVGQAPDSPHFHVTTLGG